MEPTVSPPSHDNPRDIPLPRASLSEQLRAIQKRLVREATLAIGMLQNSIDALWDLDAERAEAQRRRDDRVDMEEVAIEQECYRVLALQQPMARDFRRLAFVLKVNADIERVADHACSIAKVTISLDPAHVPAWPMALIELGERVPVVCHTLLRAVVDEDVETARRIVVGDETLDRLHDRVYEETVDLMRAEPEHPEVGLGIYRVARELERVGDLMAAIAEDVVYLATGEIIRHASKARRGPMQGPERAAS